MSFFTESDENDQSFFEEENNVPPPSQHFSKITDTTKIDSFDDSSDNENDDFNKLTQHANKKMCYTQNVTKRVNRYGSQSTETLKKVNFPKKIEKFFNDVGLETIESEEYSTCIKVVDTTLEYKAFIIKLKKYLDEVNIDELFSTVLSVITLENGLDSLNVLEIFSKPIKINENFSNSFLQVLVSIEKLQAKIIQAVFKFFERSVSEDTTVKMACGIYIDLLKDVDEIYEQNEIYDTIYNLKYNKFGTSYRNEIASFVYKFIQDFKLENELYRKLMKWLKEDDMEECESFRLALLQSIKNVYADSLNIKYECFALIKNINMFECNTVIEIINYTSMSLTTDSKNQIVLFLLALRQNLNFDKFKSSADFDKIICNMFNKIMMLITNYGANGINIVLSVFNASNNNKVTSSDFGVISDVIENDLIDNNEENENSNDEEDDLKVTVLKPSFSKFDYILAYTTISEYINPLTSKIISIAKLMAAQIEQNFKSLDETCKFMKTLLKCEEFPLKNLEALLYIGEYFLKDSSPVVNEVGQYIFLEIFVNLCYDREKIIALLIDKMLSKEDVSYNALNTIYLIVKKYPHEFADYIDYYLERTSNYCVKFESKHLRIFFKILSCLSISCSGDEVESKVSSIYDRFDHFFESIDENSFRIALSANIVRICELIRRDPEKYSSEISRILEKLDSCSNYMPEYLAYYFSEFSVNLKSGYKKFSTQSKELVEYMNKKVLHYLKDTYFVCLKEPIKYVDNEGDVFEPLFEGYNNLEAQYVMKHTTFLKRDLKDLDIWNVEMLNPLTPMIQFIYQVLRLMNKWKQQNDTASLENLYFIFEANIDLRGISSMLKKEDLNEKELSDLRLSILFLLDYLSNLLNTFADCRSSNQHNEILQKKYKLYVKLESIFFDLIHNKHKLKFTLPRLLSNGYSISRSSIVLFGIKKNVLNPKKKVVKSDADCDKSILENENIENPTLGTCQFFGNTQAPNGKKNSTKSYYKIIPSTKISDYITPFTINVLIKCIDAFLKSPYLLSKVLNGLDAAISRIEESFVSKKIPTFGFSKPLKTLEAFFPYIDKQNKNDLKRLLSDCIIPMMTVFDYCKRNLVDEPENLQYQNFAEQSLKIVFRSIQLNNNKEDCNGKKNIEEKIFQFISTNHPDLICNNNDANTTIFNYFLENESCITSSSTMAVLVINMLLDFIGENELLRLKVAVKCLNLLDYSWQSKSTINCSTANYCKDIARILETYFSLISPRYQILAIIYMVTRKLIFLAPNKEQNDLKEIGFIYSLNYAKLGVSNPDDASACDAFTPKTFSYIYNVCFTALNTSTQNFLVANETTLTNRIEKNLDSWYFAVTCFNKLVSFIKVSKFRTKSILSVVVKEGKKFINFMSSNKSIFMNYIVDQAKFNDHKDRFVQIFYGIEDCYTILSSFNSEFQKKLTGGVLKMFPQFICGFESFKRHYNNISKINLVKSSLADKTRKRNGNSEKVIEPKKKKTKLGKKSVLIEHTENMET
ncbi:Armadillo-type fold domain-containing protein [Strongyloides ratti]|uniref:Armadillo-type fold domain-containing protein n=1 Tax=Strongyloides ratti TaxID=34506 RepID=A0A090LGN0_STRRB|nr:Armadillo-type fold domain-containing protein [Strongyloides ratti]CEF67268.1 Armadillo-type fold domain-containing protein [Strongyloides ratti]